MKTCRQLALEWGVSERTVNDLCKKGKIDGAVKEGRSWLIPDDARKPADGRVSYGKYIKRSETKELKPLPIDISDYVRTQADGTYLCEVSIPNREIAAVYKNEILSHLLQEDMISVFFQEKRNIRELS